MVRQMDTKARQSICDIRVGATTAGPTSRMTAENVSHSEVTTSLSEKQSRFGQLLCLSKQYFSSGIGG